MSQILKNILNNISIEAVIGSTDIEIEALQIDSRKVEEGHLFFAIKGTQTDGHQYISQVIEKGAKAVICEVFPEITTPNITYIQVKDSGEALGWAASNFYNNPSKKLKLVGVTGTNGKTTNVTLLFNLFRKLGYSTGLLSTVQNQINEKIVPATHTTPDPINLNNLLAEMVKTGCSHCFMEVSSHAVVQHRITGLSFAGGIFTNITHDHLDFHETFDNYIKAKKGFFDNLPKDAFALVNRDDKRGMVMVQNTKAAVKTFSLDTIADFKGKILSDSMFGLQMQINGIEIHFKLIGTFNAYNLLGVYGAAVLLEEDSEEVLTQLSGLDTAPGRFQQIIGPNELVGIVDYAHTPDALENVLKTIKNLRQGNEQIITVVGCGGNRDATKRPIMAEIACKFSNKVILTSDNPRFEDPAEILEQMRKGVPPIDFKKTKIIQDRKEAIKTAVEMASPTDIILVAGKGHETYQDIRGVKHHFDDTEEVKSAFMKVQ
ncbi:MAG: UDP-N-acetylmuramoyl-L-alanyl-D-glutamate--2,6-diaminopimelate ligase [Bacteroidota bacterium]